MQDLTKPHVIVMTGREGATPTAHRSRQDIDHNRPHNDEAHHQMCWANSGVKGGESDPDIPGIKK